MAEAPWRSRSPKYNFQGIINALTWSNGFCCERGKGGSLVGKDRGPWQRSAVVDTFFNEISFKALYTTLLTSKAHFLASI